MTTTTIPADYPVQPLKPHEDATDRATCGTCGLSWDDGKVTSMTPTPSGRCPFETFHEDKPKFMEIEIVMCFDDRTWDTDFVEIPTELWERQNTDDVVSWLIVNDPPECIQIGVYNWQEDQEKEDDGLAQINAACYRQ